MWSRMARVGHLGHALAHADAVLRGGFAGVVRAHGQAAAFRPTGVTGNGRKPGRASMRACHARTFG